MFHVGMEHQFLNHLLIHMQKIILATGTKDHLTDMVKSFTTMDLSTKEILKMETSMI